MQTKPVSIDRQEIYQYTTSGDPCRICCINIDTTQIQLTYSKHLNKLHRFRSTSQHPAESVLTWRPQNCQLLLTPMHVNVECHLPVVWHGVKLLHQSSGGSIGEQVESITLELRTRPNCQASISIYRFHTRMCRSSEQATWLKQSHYNSSS